MKTLALVGLMFFFGSLGCAKDMKTYQYQFVENGVDGGPDGGTAGCDTGKQVFSALDVMCAALESTSLNQGCALSARQTFFAENCTGTFQETN